jgi:predicted metal-dependent hydrolase
MNSDSDIIEYKVIFSRRRTLGISIKPDASVIVRVPLRTPEKTIRRLVQEKSTWIIKHRDYYRNHSITKSSIRYSDGEKHLFRGSHSELKIRRSPVSYCLFKNDTIELGMAKTIDSDSVKAMLYKGYKSEAASVFPGILNLVLQKHDKHNFKPAGLKIRTMKRRWGSCSSRGLITLNTELIRLPDLYTEYVITHELCHLRHHNHGPHFYELLSELFPDWKRVRKELRSYIQ